MEKDLTLLILAAGMGSRFGGLKQIEPMGPNGEFIIDYSIYDAIKAGFNKVVFLIKEENFELFKETIGARVEPHVKVDYCFQKMDNAPIYYDELKDREKPLGTAHAVLCCKDKIHEPFMMINADDFYGADAFKKGADFLRANMDNDKNDYGIVGYLIKNTITENGSVKRGVCKIENGHLTNLVESKVERREDGIIYATPLDETLPEFKVDDNDTVSMNMLLFEESIFGYIEEGFKPFLEKNKDNLAKCEYLIPEVLFDTVNKGEATCTVIPTTATWYGVTYKEDAPAVRASIASLVKTDDNPDGYYPNHLWTE